MASHELEIHQTLSSLKWIWLLAAIIFVVVCLAGLIYQAITERAEFLDRYGFATAIVLVMLAVWTPIAARLVHRVEIQAGLLRFVTLVKALEVRQGDVDTLRPSRLHPGFYAIRSLNGTVLLPDRFTGFVRVVDAIKELNPNATFKGL